MGTDIHGWVEVLLYPTDPWQWRGVIRIDDIMWRQYDGFANLFGLNNFAGFRPIVGKRGLPDDVSEQVILDEWVDMSHSHTWITHSEILAIDWEEADEPDQRVTRYRRNPENGKWILDGKSLLPNPPPVDVTREGKTQVGDILYEVRRMKRIETRTSQWERLFSMMGLLAELFTDDGVRLVVYFDS
ncbi:MAG: hypothetical protein AAFV33_06405 [Chloroflexota bacterium]